MGTVPDDLYIDLSGGDTPEPEKQRPRELLTAAEREIIEDCSEIMNRIRRDVMHPNMNVVSILAFNQHIFAVQRMIMSNAAARAYPGVYKLLGED